MSKKHSTTTRRNFKHLTAYQRGEIQALLKEGLPKIESPKRSASPVLHSMRSLNEVQ